MNIRSQSLWVFALLLCVVQTGWAEGEPSASLESEGQSATDSQPKSTDYPEDTTLILLTVQPALPPVPALKYTMRHSWTDQYDGNAAPLYYRASLLMPHLKDQREHWDKITKWIDMPIDNLPQQEVKLVLDQYKHVFQETRHGALRRNCDWGLPMREQQDDLFSILLPEMQDSRNIARLLALKIRYEISQGNIDQAVEDLRIGFTLARHIGEEHFLVGAVIGLVISNRMLDQVYVLIEHTDTPNLYWMLASLPDSTVDYSKTIEFEKNILALLFPQLQEANRDGLPDAYWDNQLNALLSRLGEYQEMTANRTVGDALIQNTQSMLFRMHVYSQSKRAKNGLIEYGHPAVEVGEMSKSRAILLYSKHAFEELRDDLFKYSYLPFHEALPYTKLVEQVASRAKAKEIIPLIGSLLPVVNTSQAVQGFGFNRRKVAVLRTIEAIRWHAALNDGKFPNSLDQITVIPVPLNPMTGKPFNYRIQNQKVIIDMTEDYQGKDPLVIELTLKK